MQRLLQRCACERLTRPRTRTSHGPRPRWTSLRAQQALGRVMI
jgi:hypothetical protein